jgi:hypothetical protein
MDVWPTSMIRHTTVEVSFRRGFTLKGVDGAIPAGTYRVDIEEEQILGLSFLAYRRLATFIRIPMTGRGTGTVQDFLVDAKDLAAAQERDAAADG